MEFTSADRKEGRTNAAVASDDTLERASASAGIPDKDAFDAAKRKTPGPTPLASSSTVHTASTAQNIVEKESFSQRKRTASQRPARLKDDDTADRPLSTSQDGDEEEEGGGTSQEEEPTPNDLLKFIRQRNAMYSRRKYYKRKQEMERLEEVKHQLEVRNEVLRRDNAQLERWMQSARQQIPRGEALLGPQAAITSQWPSLRSSVATAASRQALYQRVPASQQPPASSQYAAAVHPLPESFTGGGSGVLSSAAPDILRSAGSLAANIPNVPSAAEELQMLLRAIPSNATMNGLLTDGGALPPNPLDIRHLLPPPNSTVPSYLSAALSNRDASPTLLHLLTNRSSIASNEASLSQQLSQNHLLLQQQLLQQQQLLNHPSASLLDSRDSLLLQLLQQQQQQKQQFISTDSFLLGTMPPPPRSALSNTPTEAALLQLLWSKQQQEEQALLQQMRRDEQDLQLLQQLKPRGSPPPGAPF